MQEDTVKTKDLLEMIGGLYVERLVLLQRIGKLEEQVKILTSSKNEG